ncbi:MAG: DnaJ domain-containing protein [Halobacteriales archaeon]
MRNDPYEVLGVPRDATDEEVETAYREKAKQYHPDVCDREDAAEMFKRVKRAYEAVLSEDPGTVSEGETRRERKDGTRAETTHSEPGSEDLGNDWSLGRSADGWFVFTETETAPHVDGTMTMYLDGDGSVSSDPVYFGTDEAARSAYRNAYSDGETDKGRQNGVGEDTEGNDVTSEDRGVIWGGTRMSNHLDSLWRLCYQEGRTRTDGRRRKRWGVTTDVSGDDRYINSDGEYQGTEFWFPTEEDARQGYKRYIRDMKQARSKTSAGNETRGSAGRTGSAKHARRHPVVEVALEELASVPERLQPAVRYVRHGVKGSVDLMRDPVISFLHYVTFPRLAVFTKASLKAFVAGYVVFIIDTAWGPGVFGNILGEGFVRALTGGMFPMLVYLAFVILLFARLLED